MCGDDEGSDEAPIVEGAPVEATIEVSPEDLAPQHGGTVVLAEDHAVEVVASPREVRAYVVNVEGQPPPVAQTTLVVNVQGDDQQLHPVTLSYDAEVGYYVAPVVRFTPVPGPMNVVLTIQGRPRLGRVATYVVLPAPAVEVELARPARRRATVVVERPSAHVVVEAPGPPSATIVVERPSAHIVVEGPRRPRGVVVVGGGHGHGKFKHRGRGLGHRHHGHGGFRVRHRRH
jgi:hypothetical protein